MRVQKDEFDVKRLPVNAIGRNPSCRRSPPSLAGRFNRLGNRPAELKQEIFKLLFNSAELANFTPDERAKYQLDMTTERDIKNQIEYARDDGMERGRQEGAREKALQTAKSLLELGVAVDIISKGTGLSVEEVEALR